jgi:DNA polymerase-3 subunit gamma/tau
MIETDRLLELIDQFAAAEGRMKWAPNKRLHFEVAVIKAIQTLSQVTLNEVIENLAALRDGKPVAGIADPGPRATKTKAAATSVPTGVTDPGSKTPSPAPEAKAIDHEAVWQKVVEQIRARRPLIHGWVAGATPLGIEGHFFQLGFPPEQKMAMESLASPRTRDFLEALIKEISGEILKVKLALKEGLPVRQLAEPPAVPAKKKEDSQATFKDDPLIREALEIFKGEIKTS